MSSSTLEVDLEIFQRNLYTFTYIELEKISRKYDLPIELVAAIVSDYKTAERFIYREIEGRA